MVLDGLLLDSNLVNVSVLGNDSGLLGTVFLVALAVLVVGDSVGFGTLLGNLVTVNKTLLEADTMADTDDTVAKTNTVANADTVAEADTMADTDDTVAKTNTVADTDAVANAVAETDSVTLEALAENISILGNNLSALGTVLLVALAILVI